MNINCDWIYPRYQKILTAIGAHPKFKKKYCDWLIPLAHMHIPDEPIVHGAGA